MIFSKNPRNNRAYPRADFYQPSYFIVDSDEAIAANECWFNNISLGGLAFESERDDLNNTVINVLYKIGPQLRKDRLQVKFSRKLMARWRYGCQFVSTDEQRNSIIARYVDQKIKSSFAS